MDAPALLQQSQRKDLLRFVTAGSIDDGKSTLIGRLLYEADGIYEDQLAAVQQASGRRGSVQNELDLSLVTDGLKAEREQGITIDVARRYFSTPTRKFIIADTPGHEQYTRNMATGASTASLMVILIDAARGVQPQSKRHAFIASLLGIRHVVVAVNKMDLVAYRREVFERISREFVDYAARLDVRDLTFIPVSALKGDNVVSRSRGMDWYQGATLLNYLETVPIAGDRNLIDLRFPVQLVQRPDETRRLYLGAVASGVLRAGDEVLVLPTGMGSSIRALLGADGQLDEAFPPMACSVELADQIDVSRGDMIVHRHNLPRVDNRFEAMLVWMADEPLRLDDRYLLKQTTRTIGAAVSQVRYRMDVETLRRQAAPTLALNEIGRVVVDLARPLAFDPYPLNRATGGFILIDQVTHNTVAAGMILQRHPNALLDTRPQQVPSVRSPDVRSHVSLITPDDRASRLGHKPVTVWLTGLVGSGKTTTAYALEKRLFNAGLTCCVLGGANMRLGISRELGFSAEDRCEQARRAAEVARMLNDAGLIVICDFTCPYAKDRRLARHIVGGQRFLEVYLSAPLDVCRRRDVHGLYDKADRGQAKLVPGVSAPYEAPAEAELVLPSHEIDLHECVERVVALLGERGVIH